MMVENIDLPKNLTEKNVGKTLLDIKIALQQLHLSSFK